MTFEEIKNTLNLAADPAQRLELLMDLGRTLVTPPADAVCTTIAGCASRVEICRKDNRFYGTADSALVAGIVAVIVSIVDGRTPEEIRQIDIRGLFSGLNLSLGAGRMNGVDSMIRFLENL